MTITDADLVKMTNQKILENQESNLTPNLITLAVVLKVQLNEIFGS